jgi:hypothetical protein
VGSLRAEKESVHDETGIAMVAERDQAAPGWQGTGQSTVRLNPRNRRSSWRWRVSSVASTPARRRFCSAADAFAATAAALKANEAALASQRIEIRASDNTPCRRGETIMSDDTTNNVSRRDFIKTTALGVVAADDVSQPARDRPSRRSPGDSVPGVIGANDRIHIGIVGV